MQTVAHPIEMAGRDAVPPMPVLVRTDLPGRPLAYIDPRPLVADAATGHAWTFNTEEPGLSKPYCALCCDVEVGHQAAARPCPMAELLPEINEDRNRWIASRRVDRIPVS